MHAITKILILVSTTVLWLPANAEDAIKLRLHEAIAIALRDNISVRNAYLSRISDKFTYRVAEWNYEPQYSLSTTLSESSSFSSGNRTNTDTASVSAATSLNIPTGGQFALTAAQSLTVTTDADRSNDGSLTLSFTQPLMRGFGEEIATASLTTAGYTNLSSQLSLKSTLISTVTSVISAYRSYFLSLRSLSIAETALIRAEEQVATNSELIKAGRIAAVDLVQSETSVANKKISLRSAQNTAETGRLSLLKLLRLNSQTQLELTEPLYVEPMELQIDELLSTAKAKQSSYLQTKLSLKSAELTRKVQKDNQRWSLGLTSSVALAGSDPRFDKSVKEYGYLDDANYSVDLTLSIPIGELDRDQSLLSANVSWLQARNNFIDTNESLRLTLLSALQSIESAWDNVDLAKKSLELSQLQLELEQEKQRAGKSTNFQVVSYQDDLATAENSYVSAQISYLNELTSLDETLGTTLEHWGIEMISEANLQPNDISDFSDEIL